MAKRKAQGAKTRPQETRPDESPRKTSSASDYASYISVVGLHTTLLAFAGLFLPRSALLLDLPVDPSQLSSKDRPQPAFLDALTRNPTATLACLCAGAAILQGWYGGWVRRWWLDAFLTGSQDEVIAKKKAVEDKKLSNIKSACFATLLASIPFHLLSVLFGAPILDHFFKTWLLSLLTSILAVFPAAYILGAPSLSNDNIALNVRMAWVRLFSEFHIRNPLERALVYPSLGALIGAWVGVIPIALDWDRPWQAWPLPPAYGSLLGCIIASLGGLTLSVFTEPWP